MKTGWVIATPDAAGWNYQIVSPNGEVEAQNGADPALAAGLLADGARIGLLSGHEAAPLVSVPCDPVAALSGIPASGAWHILPRFSQPGPVMLSAGEEIHLAGALMIAPKFDGVILVRGTSRALWAQISAGEVVSILGSLGSLAPGFNRGVTTGAIQHAASVVAAASETLSRPERLGALLASLPARQRMEGLDAAGQRDLVAGWLFGAELAAAKAWWLGQPVLLITDQSDGAAEVLVGQGLSLHQLAPATALLAGLKAIAPL